MVQVRGRRPFGPHEKKEATHKQIINGAIRATQLRVISSTGENLGLLSRAAALQRAEEEQLDLVQISGPEAETVVAKIMDFGKFLYEKKKQDVKAKKSQKVIQIKELKLRPYIEEMDYRIKLKQAAQFLEDGKRVKFTLQFRRGRELINMNALGSALFAKITTDLAALSLGTILEEKEQRGRILWSKIYYLKGK